MNKYAKRLLKLADFLCTVPRKKFKYDSWFSGTGAFGTLMPNDSLHTCGTAACAMGWATTMPAFRRLGLRMHCDQFGNASPALQCDIDRGSQDVEVAAQEIFGLVVDEFSGFDEFRHLFIPGSGNGLGGDATPKQVAKHIRKFVKTKYGVAS